MAAVLAPAVRTDVQPKKMKGVGFVNVRHFVMSTRGQASWNDVLASLSPPDKEVAAFGLAVGWYEVAAFGRLLRAVDVVCGQGNLQLLPKVGAYEAEQDFSRVYRFFLRTLSPSAFLAAESRLWRHFQDSGSWKWNSVDHGIRAILSGWEQDEALCLEMGGYLIRVLEFTGGKMAHFEHVECVSRGDKHCTFMLYWR